MYSCDSCECPAVACCICAFPLPFVCEEHLSSHPDTPSLKHMHLPLYARDRISSKALRRTWKAHLLDDERSRLQVAADFQAIAAAYDGEFGSMREKIEDLEKEKTKLTEDAEEAKSNAKTYLKQAEELEEEVKYLRNTAFVELRVSTPSGKIITLRPRILDQVKILKRQLAELENCRVERLRLSFQGRELCDEETILAYRLDSSIVLKLQVFVQIFVKCQQGSTIAVDTCLSDSVTELKQQIEKKTTIPARCQSLVYQGRLLQGEESLQSFSVKNQSTLHMSVPMPRKTVSEMLFLRSEGGTVALNFDAEQTIENLKEQFLKAAKLDKGLKVSFLHDGVTLKENKKLNAYDITGGSELFVTVTRA